jgi:hypothetical protein
MLDTVGDIRPGHAGGACRMGFIKDIASRSTAEEVADEWILRRAA